jgi:hypothetical protein
MLSIDVSVRNNGSARRMKMKIEPGQFWTVDMEDKGGNGHLEYVVTLAPLENGGWACVPIHKGYDYLSERDVFLPLEYSPCLAYSMIMAWLYVYFEDNQLIRNFGYLDPEIFETVKRLRHNRPVPDKRWVGHKWSVNVRGFRDYCEFQKRQIERWNEASQKVTDRMFALDEEVDPDTVHPQSQ